MIGSVPGLRWVANGQSVLYGALLELSERLDRRFLTLASQWGAADHRFPPFLAATVLERIDWFRSFPQLATFPACLDEDEANLARFTDAQPVDARGTIHPTDLAPIRDVLTPAACYHLYDHHAGQRFDGPRYFTTRNTCFRREAEYVPLERQWSFSMREIVCMGTAEETRSFVERATEEVDRFVAGIGLPLTWEQASDPFFRPSRNPQYLMQQVDPTKFELVFEDRLAIASTNLHHDHFGRAFDIQRDGEPVRTACVAFGIERWLAAIVGHFGAEGPWPS
ncbi:MAG: hypothetical protein M3450_01395 [Actinomycetota bacterium]|nr:hypothetical protein [Actinomycetota bacterium]